MQVATGSKENYGHSASTARASPKEPHRLEDVGVTTREARFSWMCEEPGIQYFCGEAQIRADCRETKQSEVEQCSKCLKERGGEVEANLVDHRSACALRSLGKELFETVTALPPNYEI